MHLYPTTEREPRAIPTPPPHRTVAAEADFEALFKRHRSGLLGFLIRKLRSHEDAQDALTMTFYKAWRARDTYRGETLEKTWLYLIAHRVALDVIRHRRSRREEDLPLPEMTEAHPALESPTPDPLQTVLEDERMSELGQAVHQAVSRLTPEFRQLLSLHYFEGYKYEEISSLLGIPYTKVRARLHRIRQLLRRDLEDRQCWRPS